MFDVVKTDVDRVWESEGIVDLFAGKVGKIEIEPLQVEDQLSGADLREVLIRLAAIRLQLVDKLTVSRRRRTCRRTTRTCTYCRPP